MARYERVAQIVGQLSEASGPLSLESLCATLGASTATVKRLVRFMREDLHIPVEFDRSAGGYRIEGPAAPPVGSGRAELAEHDRLALRAGFDLLAQIAPGLVDSLAPTVQAAAGATPGESAGQDGGATSRLRADRRRSRPLQADRFRTIALALLSRHRLQLRTRGHGTEPGVEHVVSPQRLTLHRGVWYLAAWCHADDRLQLFATHRIEFAASLPLAADCIEDALLDAAFESGYGLAPGAADATAVLRFTSAVAREALEEPWHPAQRLERHDDGSATLHVPYGDATELTGEILRWGDAVEVVAPAALRHRVATALAAAARRYG